MGVPGRDAWLDPLGRVWYDVGGHELPRDPAEVKSIPPRFWHPEARRKWEGERAEQKRLNDMAERELRVMR